MTIRSLLILLLALNVHGHAFAADADDINSEVDELNADSDAAAADSAEVKARMAKEKARAEKALRAAHQKNQAASAKRQASADQLRQNDDEIQRLNADQAKLKSEVERLGKEVATTEQATNDSRAQIEKLKAEIETLKGMRNEKAKTFLDLTTQHDKVVEDMKKMELEKSQLEIELNKSKEQEKAATENLQKVKTEEAAKKVKLDAYIAGLRERFHQAQERIAATEAESNGLKANTQKQEATAKVAENEVIAAEAQLNRTPTAAPAPEAAPADGGYTFKRSCKVFDKPAKGADVLTVKSTGAKVSKNGEGKTWISFPVGGRTGYAAKNCF